MSPLRRTASLVLGCALVVPALPGAPAAAADAWSEPQTIGTDPAPQPLTAVAETADGTLVAITRGSDGEFRRSTRGPGEDWVPAGVYSDPDDLVPVYVEGVEVTPDGAGWLVYTVDGSGDVRVVRWDLDGGREVVGGIVDPWTTVDLAVDDEADVLLTYGQRGGYPLSAIYGDAGGLASLDVPSWTGGQRPHQWVLGPDDDVMLVSRWGTRIRTVDVGPDGDGKTRTLDRPGGGLADEVAGAIAPSGEQYVAWTTAPDDGPRTVWLARRPDGSDWLPRRVVTRTGITSRPQRALELRWTNRGAYLLWVQPLADQEAAIRGALVRTRWPVRLQTYAGPRNAGRASGPNRLAVDVARGGRVLVAWTADHQGRLVVTAALGRETEGSATSQLFDVAGNRVPVVLLRLSSEATVAATSPSTSSEVLLRSVSTD